MVVELNNVAKEKTNITTQASLFYVESQSVQPLDSKSMSTHLISSLYLSVVAHRRLIQNHHGQWNEQGSV